MRQRWDRLSLRGLLFALPLIALGALAACGTPEGTAVGNPSPQAGPQPLEVVTTTDFLADWVRNIGGSDVNVFSLLPPGADPHSFEPGTRDITRVADADMVVTVGMGLEDDWLRDLIENASADSSMIISLEDAVEPLPAAETGLEDEDGDEDDHHGVEDPHFWFDPTLVGEAVGHVAEQLARRDPSRAETYRANAAEYSRQLSELDGWISGQAASIQPERRLLITSHDSFQYFARRYGFTVVATVIPAVTTDAEASPKRLTAIIERIEEHNLPVVFGEVTVSERLARTIAEETGATLVRLYSGSLGPPGTPEAAYLGMMRVNTQRIVENLR